jgi:hypothetical protein
VSRQRRYPSDLTDEQRALKTTLHSAYLMSPIRFVFADGGFAGKLVDRARGPLTKDPFT